MDIDQERLAQQVKLGYDFIETLHGQALALIKDVEAQLDQASDIRCVRPGGYRYIIDPQSYTLDQPRVPIPNFYGVFFRRYKGRVKNTFFDGHVPSIGFLKVVFRERGLVHPEVRFGVMSEIRKPPERTGSKPGKFEDVATHLMDRALNGPPWADSGDVRRPYEHAYVTLQMAGQGIRLAELPDSEAVAQHIVNPLLAMLK
jgi:hypothetical protein